MLDGRFAYELRDPAGLKTCMFNFRVKRARPIVIKFNLFIFRIVVFVVEYNCKTPDFN